MVKKRVAVITGAASGIGFALAAAYLGRGIQVVMADKNTTALQEKIKQLNKEWQKLVLGLECDVSQPESVKFLAKETMAQFNRIDWLFNNAGVSGVLAPIWELTSAQINEVLAVNLHGVIHGIQAFLPVMLQQSHRSHLINMASVYGLCSGSQVSAYAMSKHAVVALSESLYFDLKRLDKPVDVSVVCPSFVNTSFLANARDCKSSPLQEMVCDLMQYSDSATKVAQHIVQAVAAQIFYIIPHAEVNTYVEQRAHAVIKQEAPYLHDLEKIMVGLSKKCR